jgi:ABC-type uncharacterized transport system substrate-binding protein
MTRRELLLSAAAAAFSVPAFADAVKIVGILAPGPLRPIQSFKQRLAELGWAVGRTLRFEERWGEGDDNRYGSFAAELVKVPVDVMLTWGTPAALAAKQATTAIPVVMATIADPVGVGVVTSLSRPGGNITGFSSQNYELEEKRFELLRELVPGLRSLVILGNAANPYSRIALARVGNLAAAAGLRFEGVNLDEAGGLDGALDKLRRAKPEGVLVAAVPALFPLRKPIVEFVADNRIPAVYPFPEFAEVGGLAVYSTNFEELFRSSADYVDKVLRGTPPGELPVQQAATFKLVLNMRAARKLGLVIPPALIARADEVID